MKSRTKRIISTLAICGALIIEAGATAIGLLGKALNNIAKVDAAGVGDSIYESGSPSFGSGYACGNSTLNKVQWYCTTRGNNTCLGWNKSSQNKSSDAVMGPISAITETTKYGMYMNASDFANAIKISVTFANSDSVTGTWYIFGSTNSGTSWSTLSTGALASSTTSIEYTATAKIGNTVRFGFGFGTSKTTGTRISISNIQVWEEGSGGDTTTYSVNYLANTTDTVTGLPSPETGLSAGSHNLSTATPTRSGYDFVGWNTDSSASTGITSVTIGSSDVNVYAIWKEQGGGGGDTTGFALVTDANKLVAGTQFLLTLSSDETKAVAAWPASKSYFGYASSTVSGGIATTSEGLIFTLGGVNGSWTIKDSDYYYGLQNSTTALRSATLPDPATNYTWTISISDGIATMKTGGSGSRYLSWNASTKDRFSAYSSSCTPVKMYAKFPETKKVESITIKTPPSKTTYYEGETFDPTGLVITATYDDKSTADIAYAGNEGDFTFDPSLTTALSTSNTSVKITYKEKTVNQIIKVNSDTLNSITLGGSVAGTVSGGWDLSGVTVTGNYASGSRLIVDATPTTSTAAPTEFKEYTVSVSVTYKGVSTSKDYTVKVEKTGLTPAEAFTAAEAIAKGTTGDTPVYVKDKVTKVDQCSAEFKNATFWFGDFELYRVKLDSSLGTLTDDTVQVGQTILVFGKITTYGSTVEIGTDGIIKSITNKQVSSIAVTTNPTNTQYSGKVFDKTGMVVTATYDDGSTADVTSSVSVPTEALASTTTSVLISYTEGSVTVSTSLSVDVLTLSKITATGYKTAFRAGESFSFGGTVYPWYTHSDGSSESQGSALSSTDYTVSKSGTLSKGDGQEVTVSYGGKDLTYTINVDYAYVTGITMSSTAEVGVGGEVTFSATVAPETADQSVTYAVDTTETTLDPSEYSLSENKLTIADEITASGKVFVTATTNDVTSGGEHKTTSCQVTVTKAVIAQITEVKVTGSVTQTEQYAGKDFNYNGLTFTPEWSEGEHDEVTITGADIQWPALTDGITSITGKYSTGSSTLDVVVSGFAVVDDFLKYVFISGDMTNKTYYSNAESWNFAGLTVTGKNASGDDATITQADVVYTANKTPAEYLEEGLDKVVVTATYGGKSNTKEITGIVVNEFKLTKLEVTTAPKTSYILGEDFSSEGMVVKATYSDGSHNDNFTGYTLDAENVNKFAEGTYQVDVKVGDTTYTSIDVTYAKFVPQEGYSRFTKVTSDLADYTGTYLILTAGADSKSNKFYYAYNGSISTPKDAQTHVDVSEYWTNEETTFNSNDDLKAISVSINKVTDSSGAILGYTIKGVASDAPYIGRTSNSNGMDYFTSESDAKAKYNQITIDDSGNAIINGYGVGSGASSALKYNKNLGTSGEMFRFYKDGGTAQTSIMLFKLDEKQSTSASLIKLEAKCDKTFKEDDTLKISDLSITPTFNDLGEHDLPEVVKFADGSTEVKLTGGDNVLTVKCGDISTSITVYATPKVPVSSVAIGDKPTGDKLYYYGEFADEHQFSATVLPDDAADKSLTWSITNGDTLATIDQTGKVTVTGAGAGQVTVQAKAGEKTDTYTFSVVLDTVSSIKVTNEPDQVEYYDGETIDLAGVEVTATMTSGETHVFKYDDGAPITCTKEKAALGDTSITVEFDNKQATTDISVHEPYVTKISANTTAISVGYGTDLKDSTLVITATYEDGSSNPVTDYEISNFDNTDYSGPQEVTITFGGETITVSVTVLEPKINSLDVVNTDVVEVPYGEDLKNYITVMITTEDDDTPREYFDYDISLDFDNKDKSGVQSVRISAGEGVYDEVNVKIVDSVTIKTIDSVSGPTVVDYGTSISASDFTVNVTYTDDLPGTITPTSIDGYDPEVVDAQKVTLYNGDAVLTTTTVTVSPSTVIDHIEIVSGKEEVAYNGSLSPDDFTVKAVYTDDHCDEEAGHPDTITGFNSSILGTQIVTLTYKGETVDVEVKVLDSTVVQSVEVTSCPDNLTYGSTLSYTDIVLSVTYTDGRTVDNLNPDSISGYTGEPGENTVHYVIGNYEDDIKVTVKPSEVIASIEASTEKTEVEYGGTFTKEDVSVTYVYTDGHKLTGQAAESISGFDQTHVGAQEITVTAAGKTTTITVTVLPSTEIDHIEASTEKTEVIYGSEFTKEDVTVTIVYTDGQEVTDQAADSISGYNPTELGEQTITVSAAGKTTTITVTVVYSTVIDHIEASTEKTEVAYDGSFTPADVSVTYVYTDGHTLTGQAAESISGFNPIEVGAQTVTVTAAGKETTITVTVLPSTVIGSITASTEKTEVAYGGTFTEADVSVTYVYTDGHTLTGQAAESISGFDSTKVGEQEITVTAAGKTTTITITVLPAETIDHIEAIALKDNIEFNGDFTVDDVSVTYVYTDGHKVESQPAEAIEGYKPNHSGEQEITVTAAGKTTTITITVQDLPEEAEVAIVTENIEVAYDTPVDPNDIKITITFEDGSSVEVGADSLEGFDPTIVGEQEVTAQVGGRSVTLKINVLPSTVVEHIEVSTEKPLVNLGSNFTANDVSVTCFYTDGHSAPGTAEKIEGFNKDQLGDQEITVTAYGQEATLTISVTNHFVTAINASGYDEYVDQGREYIFNGTVQAIYADGQVEDVTASAVVSKLDTTGHGPSTAEVSFNGITTTITVNVIQTETPVEPYQSVAIIGGAVVGVSIICAGLFFFLKKFKL